MYNIKTTVGDLEVIKDAMVHLSDNNKLKIQIETIEMEFEFLNNSANKEPNFSREVIDNKWIWKLTNFENPLGTGILIPIEIGTLKGNKFYASFYVWTPDSKNSRKIINYVLYIKSNS